MKHLILLSLLTAIVACASPEAKKPEEAKKEPESPILFSVLAPQETPKPIATIDSKTLKVTYAKGTDPKKVVDQLVKGLAECQNNLSRLTSEFEKKNEKK